MTDVSLEDIARVFREEVLAGVPYESRLPPPSDFDAERLLCVAAMRGRAGELEVERRHFMSPLYGAVFECATVLACSGVTPTLGSLCAALRDQGLLGSVEQRLIELDTLTLEHTSMEQVREAASIVSELAARRDLLRELARVDTMLRSGACDYSQACFELNEFCNRVDS